MRQKQLQRRWFVWPALAASFKCVRSVWQVENIHLRNETLRMQHALMHTRTEVSGLEGDLSVVQAENRLQGSRLPQLRSQVQRTIAP